MDSRNTAISIFYARSLMKKLFTFCLSALLLCCLLSLGACGPKYDPNAEYDIYEYFDYDDGELAKCISSSVPTMGSSGSGMLTPLKNVRVTRITGTAYYFADTAFNQQGHFLHGIVTTDCYEQNYSWNRKEDFSFDFVMTPASSVNSKTRKIPSGVWKKGEYIEVGSAGGAVLLIRNLKIEFVPA